MKVLLCGAVTELQVLALGKKVTVLLSNAFGPFH